MWVYMHDGEGGVEEGGDDGDGTEGGHKHPDNDAISPTQTPISDHSHVASHVITIDDGDVRFSGHATVDDARNPLVQPGPPLFTLLFFTQPHCSTSRLPFPPRTTQSNTRSPVDSSTFGSCSFTAVQRIFPGSSSSHTSSPLSSSNPRASSMSFPSHGVPGSPRSLAGYLSVFASPSVSISTFTASRLLLLPSPLCFWNSSASAPLPHANTNISTVSEKQVNHLVLGRHGTDFIDHDAVMYSFRRPRNLTFVLEGLSKECQYIRSDAWLIDSAQTLSELLDGQLEIDGYRIDWKAYPGENDLSASIGLYLRRYRILRWWRCLKGRLVRTVVLLAHVYDPALRV